MSDLDKLKAECRESARERWLENPWDEDGDFVHEVADSAVPIYIPDIMQLASDPEVYNHDNELGPANGSAYDGTPSLLNWTVANTYEILSCEAGCYWQELQDACPEEDTSMRQEDARSCIIDGASGIYVPQRFAQGFDMGAWGVSDEDQTILVAGPDEEHYWGVWDTVLQGAEFTNKEGNTFRLEQDDSLFAVDNRLCNRCAAEDPCSLHDESWTP